MDFGHIHVASFIKYTIIWIYKVQHGYSFLKKGYFLKIMTNGFRPSWNETLRIMKLFTQGSKQIKETYMTYCGCTQCTRKWSWLTVIACQTTLPCVLRFSPVSRVCFLLVWAIPLCNHFSGDWKKMLIYDFIFLLDYKHQI